MLISLTRRSTGIGSRRHAQFLPGFLDPRVHALLEHV